MNDRNRLLRSVYDGMVLKCVAKDRRKLGL